MNVYPAEVERALLGAGGVADAAAVGVPVGAHRRERRRRRRRPCPAPTSTSAALQRAVRDALGAHAVPRPLRVVDALPRNRNGKVDRAAVRSLLRQRRRNGSDGVTLRSPEPTAFT